MAIIYKDPIACNDRNQQVIADVTTALRQGRTCLVLTNWTGHLDAIASALRALGHDPVILKGGTGAKERAAALARLTTQPGGPPLLAVATGPYAGEGFDCPPLDTLFLAGVLPALTAPPSLRQAAATRFLTAEPGQVVGIDGVAEVLDHEGVLDVDIAVAVGDTVRPVQVSWDRVGQVLLTAPSTADAVTLCARLARQISVTTEQAPR
jgi:hypothetical protein